MSRERHVTVVAPPSSPPRESRFSNATFNLPGMSVMSIGSHIQDEKQMQSELHCLAALDTIFLEQMHEEGEKLPGMELDNQYILKNGHGQRILLATENTSFWYRCCFGSSRPFQVNVYNDRGHRVFNIERRWTFGLCCVCGICCGNKVEVTYDSGDVMGYVRHVPSCTPTFEVSDDTGKPVFIIKGPPNSCVCCKVTFKIYTADNEKKEIGIITKEWGGILKESFTDLDTFGIQFPKTLRPDLKAILIGSTFLMDFTYFESRG